MSKKLVIVGGGGFGVELYSYIVEDIESGKFCDISFKGVLDDAAVCELCDRVPSVSNLGRIADYQIEDNDLFILAIGVPEIRARVKSLLDERGANYLAYTHPSAWVAENAALGNGCIVGPNAMVSAYANVGENAVLNAYACLGHGAKLGKHSVLSPFCAVSGDAQIGDLTLLGTRVTVFPRKKLGMLVSVDAHTVVRADVPDRKIVTDRNGKLQVLENRLAGRNLK